LFGLAAISVRRAEGDAERSATAALPPAGRPAVWSDPGSIRIDEREASRAELYLVSRTISLKVEPFLSFFPKEDRNQSKKKISS
jgi:hypothetical protein